MNSSIPTTEPTFPRRLIPLLIAQALAALGTAFLQMGFFFYATNRWGWQPRNNLLLSAGEGVTYICGALAAHAVAEKLGRKGSVIVLPIVVGAITVCCGIYADHRMAVASMLLVFAFVIGAYWPALESLVAAGADSQGMARRLAVYNLLWPAVAALGAAACGLVIAHCPRGFFFISAAITVMASVVMGVGGPQPEEEKQIDNNALAHPGPAAEPGLLQQRTLALWLSRIALPSTYIASSALAALMPTLPSLAWQNVSVQTAIGSIWLVGRFAGFCLLAASAFWHTRPRLLIGAAVLMLIAFIATCVPISTFTGNSPGTLGDLWTMSIAQFVLGGMLALIYSASLYFGMVLSEGSTEHGGYHEALIGLGQVLGPGVAAAAQVLQPGNIFPAVAAVSALLVISIVASQYAAMRFGKQHSINDQTPQSKFRARSD